MLHLCSSKPRAFQPRPVDGDPTTVGIRADKVHEVTEVAASALEETPRIGMRWRPEFIRCIGKRGADFIIVPDIARIFAGAALDEPEHQGAAA